MGIPITFKIGVETFDREFRETYLNKHADFQSPEEVRKYFDSPCLMVGIKGQTKEMIDHDMQMLKTHFELGTVNVFTNNSTDVTRDQELVDWFMKNMRLFWTTRVWKSYMKNRFRCGGLKYPRSPKSVLFCIPLSDHFIDRRNCHKHILICGMQIMKKQPVFLLCQNRYQFCPMLFIISSLSGIQGCTSL